MTDRDSPAASPASAARIPLPEGGLGSHELEIESDDPVVLRQALQRARERLAFYESFDRIIGENIRRSGELMLETIALREEAQAAEVARIAREAEIERERRAEHDRTKALLTDLRDEIAGFQVATGALGARVASALRSLDSVSSAEPASDPAPVEGSVEAPLATSAPDTGEATASPEEPAHEGEVAPDDPAASSAIPSATPVKAAFRPIRQPAVAPSLAAARPQPAPEDAGAPPAVSAEGGQRTIDLVVNGIARATTALAFQRELNALDGVTAVETREFAEGVLRLKVDVTNDDALSDAAFAAWSGPGPVQVVTRQPTLIALDLSEA